MLDSRVSNDPFLDFVTFSSSIVLTRVPKRTWWQPSSHELCGGSWWPLCWRRRCGPCSSLLLTHLWRLCRRSLDGAANVILPGASSSRSPVLPFWFLHVHCCWYTSSQCCSTSMSLRCPSESSQQHEDIISIVYENDWWRCLHSYKGILKIPHIPITNKLCVDHFLLVPFFFFYPSIWSVLYAFITNNFLLVFDSVHSGHAVVARHDSVFIFLL